MKNFNVLRLGLTTCLMVGLFLMSSAGVKAQKADFTGSWVINEAKSPMPENGFRMGSNKITATQDEAKLNLERTFKGMDGEDMLTKEVYTLDGKDCENLFFMSMKRKSNVSWSADGKVLIINSVTLFERDGETREMKTVETFKLSDDGSELITETSFNTPNGDMKSTVVYSKTK